MRQLVDQFNAEHQNIKVSMNVLQWADFYPKVPTAVQSGNGPDVAIMHIDQLATNAARRVIIPVDDIATVLELAQERLRPDRLVGRRLQGASATASPWTSTRCSSTTTRRTSRRPASARRPRTGPASRPPSRR